MQKLSETISRRYLIKDRKLETLATRTSSALFKNDKNSRQNLYNAMVSKKFFPAGNTLLAGVEPIRPNCTILPSFTNYKIKETLTRAENLWKARIGIGFDLDKCSNPVLALKELSKRNLLLKF